MWALPGSGIEFMSPALTGGLFTTETPGKHLFWCFLIVVIFFFFLVVVLVDVQMCFD